MAVMETTETVSRSGFKKKIDEESQNVILNIVQVALYQFPFKSMIREIVSNAVDAVKEKESARLILTGAAQVSDFYVEMEGDLYKNSRFNPEYYSLPHLSADNTVHIDYIVNEDISGRDTLVIKDNGVGLGGTRLEKFFMPGASSKRLNKQALGKFGIGNKSPLSTGVESYRLVSYYNGMRFEFEIREDKIDSVVPRFDEDGTENPHVIFEDTYDMRDELMKVYYTPTTSKNSVEIVVEVKKHNKRHIEEGVKSQLMYFKEDIVFTEVRGKDRYAINFKSPILLENEDVILPVNTSYYNKPHFILNGVCYGLIDFQEMELNPRFGCIGIKFDLGKIDVNPSRESVAYTTKTKNAILEQYSKITKVVEEQIEKELTSTDPMQWLKAANSIMHSASSSGNQTLNRLSNLIDKKELKPRFSKDGVSFSYKYDLKAMFGKYIAFEVYAIQGYGDNAKVKKEDLDTIAGIDFAQLYYRDVASATLTNAYMCSLHGRFYGFKLDVPTEHKIPCVAYLEGDISAKTLKHDLGLTDVEKDVATLDGYLKSLNILKLLLTSKDVKSYSAIVVPDSYENSFKAKPVLGVLTPAEKLAARKAAGEFLYSVVATRSTYGSSMTFSSNQGSMGDFTDEIYYGHNADTTALMTLTKLLRHSEKLSSDFSSDNLSSNINGKYTVVKVAQSLKKTFKGHTHVNDFGFYIEDGKLMFHNIVKPYLIKRYAALLGVGNRANEEVAFILSAIDPVYQDFNKTHLKEGGDLHGLNVEKLIDKALTTIIEPKKTLDEIFGEDFAKMIPNGVDINCVQYKETIEGIKELTEVYHNTFRLLFSFAFNGGSNYLSRPIDRKDLKTVTEYLPTVLNTKRYKLTNDYENLF